MYEYENVRRVIYGDGGATFIPVCQSCCRFVRADKTIKFNEIMGLSPDDNATCSKCGRTKMIFEGFI